MTLNNEPDIFLHHPPEKLSKCRNILFAVIALTMLVSMVYSNSLDCSWHFDDVHSITENPNIHMEKLSWEFFYNAFHSDPNNPNKIYRPVSCLSFALNYYFGKLNVSGYHLVNISIHLIASIFLFLFIYRLFDLPILKDKFKDSSYFIALIATVLWTINPIQGQAITYIVQRMASMAGMFYIMAMYFYLNTRISPGRVKGIIFFSLFLAAFLLSLGSKENALMLPFSLFILEIFLLNSNPFKIAKKHYTMYLIILFVLLLIGILYILLKDINLYEILFSGYKDRPFTLGQRLLTESRIIIFYISLILYPVPTRLNISHDIDLSTSLFTPLTTIISIFVIMALIVFAVYRRRKYPLLAFSICFFFLNHMVESSFLNLELIFEHRNYIPSMFFFLPIAAGLSWVLNYYKTKKSMQYMIIVFIVFFLVGLGHSTFIRNFTWKNEKSLWIDAIDKSPDLARPHHNLGKYYDDYGYPVDALSEYRKALTFKWTNRKDESFTTYYNLGTFFTLKKDYERAMVYYEKALQINPDFAGIYNNLATIYYTKGDAELGYKNLEKAFFLSPYHPFTNLNLGLHFLKKKEPEKALYHLVRSNTEELFTQSQSYTGIAYKQMKRYGMAIACFRNVVEKDPENALAYLHMADIYLSTGRRNLALQQVDKALLLMFKDRTLFNKTLDTLNNDNSTNIYPSIKKIAPLIEELINDRTNELSLWQDYLKKL